MDHEGNSMIRFIYKLLVLVERIQYFCTDDSTSQELFGEIYEVNYSGSWRCLFLFCFHFFPFLSFPFLKSRCRNVGSVVYSRIDNSIDSRLVVAVVVVRHRN